MFIYGKTASNAIAVMSFLAEDKSRRTGSGEIAESRGISQALTAKLLTQLASAGLVSGQPGPGGGYTLAKSAKDISLMDIVELFEQTNPPSLCPFGHNWCGAGKNPCPLHDTILEMVASNRRFMHETRLSVFEKKQMSSAAMKRNLLTARERA
ncbi:MAG: transcriptional regulator, BadM/Rrf2 family [Verrucomicrobiales bacterium]|nr:transcriptional regulator, BadM/Rrf2 family [Verrucomicrobiales bacterium]